MKKQYITVRAVCPACHGKSNPGGFMIEDYVCQHCADTGFVNVPFEVKEGEPAVEAFVDTREQATVKVAVKVAVAIVIGALALLGFTAFAIWSGL